MNQFAFNLKKKKLHAAENRVHCHGGKSVKRRARVVQGHGVLV
jgi:hypothetical protein